MLDLGLHAFTKERSVGQDDRAASALVFEQFLNDEDEEHVGGLSRLNVGGEVGADTVFFHTAEGRIGDDAVYTLVEGPIVPTLGEGVAALDHARHLDAVEEHVGGAEEVRKLFFLYTADAFGDGLSVRGTWFPHAFDLIFEPIDSCGQEASSAAGGVEHGFALFQAGVDPLHHELGDGARGIEFAGISGAAQVIENLLIDPSHLSAGLHIVEVDDFVELLDNAEHEGTGFHVVVGIGEDFADDLGLGVVFHVKTLKTREHLVVDVIN